MLNYHYFFKGLFIHGSYQLIFIQLLLLLFTWTSKYVIFQMILENN